MQLSDEQKREQLKKAVIAKSRDLVARREQITEQGLVGRRIWQAMLDAPTWAVAVSPPPPLDKEWVEPEEVWTLKTTVNP
jgi:hypothetical protein